MVKSHHRQDRRPTPPTRPTWDDGRRSSHLDAVDQEDRPHRQNHHSSSNPRNDASPSASSPPRHRQSSTHHVDSAYSHAEPKVSSSDRPYDSRRWKDNRREQGWQSRQHRDDRYLEREFSSYDHRYHDPYRRNPRDADWRRSPPPPPVGPALEGHSRGSHHQSSWREISPSRERSLVSSPHERKTNSHRTGHDRPPTTEGSSRRLHSPPSTPTLPEHSLKSTPSRSAPSRNEEGDGHIHRRRPSLNDHTSSNSSGRPADSEARKKARRAASRSATAHDRHSGGLIYDEDHREESAGGERQKREDSITESLNGRKKGPHSPTDRARRGEGLRSEASQSESRSDLSRRQNAGHRPESPTQDRRNGSQMSAPEAPRIPTGPRAHRESRSSQNIEGYSAETSNYTADAQRNDGRFVPPARIPRGPRYSHESINDRYNNHPVDRGRNDNGWSHRQREAPTSSKDVRTRGDRLHERDDLTHSSVPEPFGRSQTKVGSSVRPPPPPSATTDALAYGSVSPEVHTYRDHTIATPRQSLSKDLNNRSRRERSRSFDDDLSSVSSRSDSRNPAMEGVSYSHSRHSKSSRKRGRSNSGAMLGPRKKALEADEPDEHTRESSTAGRLSRKIRPPSSRTPPFPSRSPSPGSDSTLLTSRHHHGHDSRRPRDVASPEDRKSRGEAAASEEVVERRGDASGLKSGSRTSDSEAKSGVDRGGATVSRKNGEESKESRLEEPVEEGAPARVHEVPRVIATFASSPDTASRPRLTSEAREDVKGDGSGDGGDDDDEEIDDGQNALISTPPRALPSELYTRIAQVGEGTYGQVFKAKSERTNVLVALKKIRMEAEKDGFPITAMREIKLLQMLRHPNVVRLHEIMTARGSVYMVFEYMEHDLNGVLNHPNVNFTPAHLKSLASQLLEGLGYLHHKSVLHRDLKGSNVLLNNAGLLKLADFGLARLFAKGRAGDYTNRVVTLWYRPPELLLGATKYGAEVDVWGAGCIFLELFNRRPILQGMDEISQLQVISDLLGPLDEQRWKGVERLPWWELVRPHDGQGEVEGEDAQVDMPKGRASLKDKYSKHLSPGALELAEALLTLDPNRRVTASAALQMAYFTSEEPKARLPSKVLSRLKGEWHELESKRARQKSRA